MGVDYTYKIFALLIACQFYAPLGAYGVLGPRFPKREAATAGGAGWSVGRPQEESRQQASAEAARLDEWRPQTRSQGVAVNTVEAQHDAVC